MLDSGELTALQAFSDTCSQQYSVSELELHDTESSCIVRIGENSYDLTAYAARKINSHPPGP